MEDIGKSIMIYMKNEQGVAVPIFVKVNDPVRSIWMEAATTRAIHRGTLKGKAFFHNGRRLKATDIIGEMGIVDHDTVRLMKLNQGRLPSTDSIQGDELLNELVEGKIEDIGAETIEE
ncbi:unnamed protein product [Cylicocyclus nassatus]|uniref:Ubiquitin-like domain-containing protein n=1 Tax=Cylicocyclus nassatus TaxID=53992 RepID=A0AA36DME3_CYLNA|nr:unnamed protein product [Cylicocyclus nassatus]